MTAEFSDISIGSAGSAFRGWNTVIIRTEAGVELVKFAKARGILETQALPDQRLSHLKSVALKRKRTAFKNIFERTHDKANLLYVGGLTKDLIEKFLED
jgi:coenzyme F420 hydrogenase subunit beta